MEGALWNTYGQNQMQNRTQAPVSVMWIKGSGTWGTIRICFESISTSSKRIAAKSCESLTSTSATAIIPTHLSSVTLSKGCRNAGTYDTSSAHERCRSIFFTNWHSSLSTAPDAAVPRCTNTCRRSLISWSSNLDKSAKRNSKAFLCKNRESQVASDLWILCFFVFILWISGKRQQSSVLFAAESYVDITII